MPHALVPHHLERVAADELSRRTGAQCEEVQGVVLRLEQSRWYPDRHRRYRPPRLRRCRRASPDDSVGGGILERDLVRGRGGGFNSRSTGTVREPGATETIGVGPTPRVCGRSTSAIAANGSAARASASACVAAAAALRCSTSSSDTALARSVAALTDAWRRSNRDEDPRPDTSRLTPSRSTAAAACADPNEGANLRLTGLPRLPVAEPQQPL